jgi:hypothetical protein
MTQNQASNGNANDQAVRIRTETLHIAAGPRELAKRRLRLMLDSKFELPTAA